MRPMIAAFFEFSGPVFWMSAAGLALLMIGLWAAKNDIAQAHGLDRIVALTNYEPGVGADWSKRDSLNYFADTLLFGATILSLAHAHKKSEDATGLSRGVLRSSLHR